MNFVGGQKLCFKLKRGCGPLKCSYLTFGLYP